VINNTIAQLERHDRNMTITEESRHVRNEHNHSREEESSREVIVFDGNRIQSGNTFWYFNAEASSETSRRYTRIFMDWQGDFREASGTVVRPRRGISGVTALRHMEFEYLVFRGGRMVLDTDALLASAREEWYEEFTTPAEREANPFPEPHRRDRGQFEITVRDGLIHNIFQSTRSHVRGITVESRLTIDWDTRTSVTIPIVTEGPALGW